MQGQDLIQRDLAAGFLVVENLEDPLAVPPKRPCPIAVIGREGPAGKTDDRHGYLLVNVPPGYKPFAAGVQ